MRHDIVPGAHFPDFALTDHTRTRRSLSELQGDDPMIVILSRGGFCPKDHQQHRELMELYPRIAVAYTSVVTISTDNLLKTIEFRDALGAQWPFLADPGRKVQQALDIQDYTDPWNDPMLPYTLVLEPELIVHSLYLGHWFWGRPSPEQLRRDLRDITRKIRPDWDPSATGLRAAWDGGDRSQHWPYCPGGPTDVYPELTPTE